VVKRKSRLDKFVQFLIPPSLVLLLVLTLIELFYQVSFGMGIFIDIFDVYVIIVFAIDLYYRWQDLPHLGPYLKKHWLDVIATIPFTLIFYGIQGLALIKALRGVRILSRVAKLARYGRLFRLLRFGTRTPRFLRIGKHAKKRKIRKVQPHQKKMKGVLSFKVILLVTINSIMGTGIWFLISAGAKHAGPASLISWGILSIISIYIAMCFSELTAMFPKAGGVYEFAKQSYGRFWSFIIGWTTAIAGNVTIAMLLLGALQYALPIEQFGQYYIPIALILIIVFNFIAYKGMQTSTYLLVGFALLTLFTVFSILVPGLLNVNIENFTPFAVFPTLTIVITIFFIAETFFGWESAIFLSAETKNPTKVMPKALIYGTIIIAILAFLLAFTGIGNIPWETFGESAAPIRDLGEANFGFTGKIIFTILVFLSIIGAVASWTITAPRLLMSIAEDKLFFVQFAKIHPKHKSPYISIIFQAVVVSALVIIGAGKYETLLHMLIPLVLVVYSAVLLGVVVLRYKKPEVKRPYRVIWGKFGPILTTLFMIFLLVMFVKETHNALDVLKISAFLVLLGIPSYFAIEIFYEKKYVTLRRNVRAWFAHRYHKLPLSLSVFKKVIKYVGEPNNRTEFLAMNAHLGAFTQRLLKGKRKFKSIHVVHQSALHLKYLKESISLDKVHLHKVRTLKIPEIGKVNKVVDFNTIGYVKDISKFLGQLNKVLVKRGKFCFYIKSNFLNVAPNSVTLDDKKKIVKLFKDAGFEINYKRKSRIYKTELYLYGYKK
jgi:basic amino acid/polyamine antiporter, APA family